MPNARGARKVGLYQVMMAPEEAQGLYQVPREGWQADGTDSHLALAEKRKYMRNEWQVGAALVRLRSLHATRLAHACALPAVAARCSLLAARSMRHAPCSLPLCSSPGP